MTRPDLSLQAIGIDGCPGGWFYVGLADKGPPCFGLVSRIREVARLMAPRTRVLLDMPMGLKHEGRKERDCDRMARKLLGRKGASIFPVPVRPALEPGDYRDASAVNQACTGRKLSIQSFNIMKKISEVDLFIREFPGRDRILESHPELCFLSLNRFSPLCFSKKTARGRTERLEILASHLPAAPVLYETAAASQPRKCLALDDILDALVLAAAAAMPLVRMPDPPPADKFGIPMQIVYPRIS